METWLNLSAFIHIMGVVFMSAPLYNLIVVNERALLGPMDYKLDRYMENLIKGSATRCFVFQLTVLATGILQVVLSGMPLTALLSNWILLAKTGLLLVLTGLLSYVHFGIQPKIENLLAQVSENPIPVELAEAIKPLRVLRKRLAGVCLFLVITTIILGLQVVVRYDPILTVSLMALAILFSWWVYRKAVPFGWV